MFRFFLALSLAVCGLSVGHGQDIVTSSPHGTFKIIQHRREGWMQAVQFGGDAAHIVTLEWDISWPALYYIPPDERWILRIQKSGSGDNICWLYQLDDHHRIWRMEEQIGALGFAYLARFPDTPRDLYHTGIDFVSWDLEKGLLNLTIHGSDNQQSGHGIECPLIYDLREGIIKSP